MPTTIPTDLMVRAKNQEFATAALKEAEDSEAVPVDELLAEQPPTKVLKEHVES